MDPDPPQMQPPPGVAPDPTRSESLGQYNVLCQVVCLTLATIAVALRVFTTVKIVKQWRLDDYTCCFSWACLIIYGSLITVMTNQYGGGVHMWNLPGSIAIGFLYLNNICQILYGPFIMVTKASILLLLARIFAPQRRGLIYVMVHLLIWLNLVFYGAVTIVKIVQCIPRARIWDSSVTGTCIDLTAVLKTTGIFNTASDLFILVLPIREIWKLKMEIRQKLGVSAAFAVGLVALTAAILRLEVSFAEAGNMDKTYYQLFILLWSEAEIAAGVICSCLPTLPALFRHYFRKHFPHSSERPSRPYGHARGDVEHGVPRRFLNSSNHTRRHSRTLRGSKYLGKNEGTLFDEEYLGLAEPSSLGSSPRSARVAHPPTQRVVTTIRGDARSVIGLDDMSFNPANNTSSASVNQIASRGDGIVKTVRIDQFGSSTSEG